MRRSAIAVIFLFIGLAVGGGLMWYYAKPAPAPEPKTAAQTERKILFYRNPMDPNVTSPTPMKDPMGMDYIPVYEDAATEEKAPPGAVRISPEKIQKIGVRSEEAVRRPLKRVIRTVGRVEPVEDKVFIINTKVEGWIERLYVNRTDQMVSKGEKLLELYSPELVSAQEEYLLALKSLEQVRNSPYPDAVKRAQSLVQAARTRLKNWDISDDQIERLERTGQVTKTLAIRSPGYGSVTEKMVVEGQKINPGEPLFKIIDHSVVWVYGEIYEYEIPYVKVGQTALLSPAYSPNEIYKGRIEHIYTHLGSIRYAPEEGTEVRTEKVRFSLPNKDHRLKLGMYLNAEISVDVSKDALAVPDSAVIDTGTRQLVIIDRRDGTFEPREIKIGARTDDYYQVLKGVKDGEWVVTSANFLIDSESNLKAAVGSMAPSKAQDSAAKETQPPAKTPSGENHAGH